MVETVISNEINCVGLTIINLPNEACQPLDLSQIKPPNCLCYQLHSGSGLGLVNGWPLARSILILLGFMWECPRQVT